MGTLHLVGRSLGDSHALAQCLGRAGQGDAVLLLAEAVYAAVGDGNSGDLLGAASGGIALHVLLPDLVQRGLAASNLKPGIQPVDYPGFVALTTAYHPIVSWF